MTYPRGLVRLEDQQRIRAAMEAREAAYVELRAAVDEAMDHGASLRELAALMGVAVSTITRWKRDRSR